MKAPTEPLWPAADPLISRCWRPRRGGTPSHRPDLEMKTPRQCDTGYARAPSVTRLFRTSAPFSSDGPGPAQPATHPALLGRHYGRTQPLPSAAADYGFTWPVARQWPPSPPVRRRSGRYQQWRAQRDAPPTWAVVCASRSPPESHSGAPGLIPPPPSFLLPGATHLAKNI